MSEVIRSKRGQAVLISLQADPDFVGVKRSCGAFEAQKAIARGDGKNSLRPQAGKSFLFLVFFAITERGALAQLGEHLLCKQRVIGSIPIGSTKRCGQRMRGQRAAGSVAQVVRAHA
jgi:hypothetical protein